ncbi:MAG: hypothetical protein HFI19_06545 [Lachnospiraceae bacterium]|nr:hypothetical protein [Lachnospiraceae bacterium]
MTEPLFFDTDCLCAFLWVRNESLLPKLYPERVIIPKPVYRELCRPGIPHLKARVDTLIKQKQVLIQEMDVYSKEYATYYELTEEPKKGQRIIGNGEAAAISLAKQYDGIVASNNLRDIQGYITEFGLRHMTTGDILTDAFQRGFITEDEGNDIWAQMLAKRRKLGAKSFTDYLKLKI